MLCSYVIVAFWLAGCYICGLETTRDGSQNCSLVREESELSELIFQIAWLSNVIISVVFHLNFMYFEGWRMRLAKKHTASARCTVQVHHWIWHRCSQWSITARIVKLQVSNSQCVPIPVAEWSKSRVCGSLIAGIAGSNPPIPVVARSRE